MPFVQFNRTVRYFVLQGMPYSPVKFTGAPDAQLPKVNGEGRIANSKEQAPHSVHHGCATPRSVGHQNARYPRAQAV